MFGDEGKAGILDAVTRELGATLVVRFCGGAQRAGRVVLSDGRAHIFSQFGSGTLSGAATFLSKHMMLDPPAMENEAVALEAIGVKLPFLSPGVWIDKDTPVISPYHRSLNRLQEWSRGEARHGSCGMGIGALAEDLGRPAMPVLRAADLQYQDIVEDKLRAIYEYKRPLALDLRLPKNVLDVDVELDLFRPWDTYATARLRRWLDRYERFSRKATILSKPVSLSAFDNIVFEGAQGVLLDETHGFAPYHTWSNCTPANALAMLHDEGDVRRVTVIGVTRTYATRHGAGPFPTEDPRLASCLSPEPSNHCHPYQGVFRVGHLDAVLLRYALQACGGTIDGLAVTHCDAPLRAFGLATRYEEKTCLSPGTTAAKLAAYRPHYRAYVGEHRLENFLRGVELETQRPILVESFGPDAAGKRWTLAWRDLIDGKQASA